MSVTIAGINGYEYQYKATVLMGLSNLSQAAEMFVEKKGSEDATLSIINSDTTSRLIEIQVKNSATPVDIPTLADWLVHFEERSASNNLLSRLLHTNNLTLFITSARCQDDTAVFVTTPPEIKEHTGIRISSEWINKFVQALATNQYTGQTDLQKDRDEFCKKQANNFRRSTSSKKALNRLLIWERTTEEDLDHIVQNALNIFYKIPQSLTIDTYLQLLEAVRKGRDKNVDIIPLFQQILAQRKGDGPLLDADYQSRMEEKDLIAKLNAKGLLLLTGRTQCGKSEIAKKIADIFYQKGFSYRICNDVGAVDSFFNLNAIEDKICILEDPWGHIEPASHSLDTLRKLELIAKNQRSNHKLIITTRIEILNNLNSNNQQAGKICGSEWVNITISDSSILSTFWQLFARDRKLDESVIKKIDDELQNSQPDSILQIGELQHLARYDQDLKDKNVEELLHIARQTSWEVANDILIKNSEAADLLAIVGCTADTTYGIPLLHLGFILSTDDTEYSILKDTMFSAGGLSKPDPFPVYNTVHTLSPNWQNKLEYLERRGLIMIRNGEVWISHPNYSEAAKTLSVSNSTIRQERILKYFHKAITCISPQSALRAVKQLPFLLDNVSREHIAKVVDLAFLALRCIFPSVSDQSLVFLVSRITDLPSERKKELEQVLDSSDTSASHIFWQGIIPYISSHSGSLFRDRFFELPETEFASIRKKFEYDQAVNSLEAWSFIRTIANKPEDQFTTKEANYLMRYDELFIRKRAADMIVSDADDVPNQEMLETVFGDEHPSVVFTAIRTVLINWNRWAPAAKPALKQLIATSLNANAVAIRSHQFLTTFEKEYTFESIPWEVYSEDEKKELWNLWSELYVAFIKLLPANLFLDSTGFGETIDTAFKYLEKANGMAVLYAWYGRIDSKLNSNLVLDEYELAIADVLLSFTGSDASMRADLFRKLLAYQDTGFIISTLKWTVSRWDTLSNEEKKTVADLMRQDRLDNRWLKTIVLTRYGTPPAELQVEIFGDANFFDKTPMDFVNEIHPQLLEDCLKFYFGHPQPLWWFATQYNNIGFWQPVVCHILTNNIEPFFTICLRELTSWGLNGFSGPWKDHLPVWEELCARTSDLTAVAERLIYDTSRINCSVDTAKKIYDVLISAFRNRGKEEELIQLVADNIEMLQQTGGGLEDLFEIFDNDFLNEVYASLTPDNDLFSRANSLKNDPTKQEALINKIKEIKQARISIRFQPTIEVMKKILSNLSLTNVFKDELNRIPNSIVETGKRKAEVWRKKDEYKLPDWIGIN